MAGIVWVKCVKKAGKDPDAWERKIINGNRFLEEAGESVEYFVQHGYDFSRRDRQAVVII